WIQPADLAEQQYISMLTISLARPNRRFEALVIQSRRRLGSNRRNHTCAQGTSALHLPQDDHACAVRCPDPLRRSERRPAVRTPSSACLADRKERRTGGHSIQRPLQALMRNVGLGV